MSDSHEATFSSGVAVFTWVTGGNPVAIGKTVRRLLRHDLVETVTDSIANEVWLSGKYKKLDRVVAQAKSLRDLDQSLTDGTLRFRDLVRRHPRIATRHLLNVITGANGRPQLAEEYNLTDAMDDVIRSSSERIAEIQAPSAILRTLEQETFRPSYLERSPWARVQLPACMLTLFDDGDHDEQLITPFVSLHSNGVVTVSLVVRLPAGATAFEIANWERADRLAVKHGSLPSNVASLVGEIPSGTHGTFDLDAEHDGWVPLNSEVELDLTDVWNVYRDLLSMVGGLEFYPEWMCYPSAYLSASNCCASPDDWAVQHRQEFAALMTKRPKTQPTREPPDWRPPPDSSFSAGRSLWHSSALTVSIDWDRTDDWHLGDVAHSLLVVEAYLVQLWTLRLLTDALPGHISKGIRGIRRMQARLIGGLEEFDHPIFSYQSAQESVRRMLDESDTERTYQRLRSRVGDLATLVATMRAENIARRNLWVAVGALLAAVTLGIPTLIETLESLARIAPDAPILGPMLAPLRRPGFDASETAVWVAATVPLTVGLLAIYKRARLLLARAIDQASRRRRLPLHRWSGGTVRVLRSAPSQQLEDDENDRLAPSADTH